MVPYFKTKMHWSSEPPRIAGDGGREGVVRAGQQEGVDELSSWAAGRRILWTGDRHSGLGTAIWEDGRDRRRFSQCSDVQKRSSFRYRAILYHPRLQIISSSPALPSLLLRCFKLTRFNALHCFDQTPQCALAALRKFLERSLDHKVYFKNSR